MPWQIFRADPGVMLGVGPSLLSVCLAEQYFATLCGTKPSLPEQGRACASSTVRGSTALSEAQGQAAAPPQCSSSCLVTHAQPCLHNRPRVCPSNHEGVQNLAMQQ